MKKIARIVFVVLFLLGANRILAQQPATCFLEAEDFQFRGGWLVEKLNIANASNGVLRVFPGKVAAVDALTVIDIKTSGHYMVWVRAADYPADKPGTRLFRLYVNEQPMEQESGKHGKEGYYWEKVGAASLETGETVLRLKDTRISFGRCDAVLLTTDQAFDPNEQDMAALKKLAVKPLVVPSTMPQAANTLPAVHINRDARVVAAINNDQLRLQFLEVQDATGKKRLAAKTSFKQGRQWVSMDAAREDNAIMLLRAQEPQVNFSGFYAAWNGSIGFSHFTSRGKSYQVLEPDQAGNPFLAGQLTACIPVAAQKTSDNSIEVTYQTTDGQTLTGQWQLNKGASHLQVALHYTAQQNGFYSLVITALQGVPAAMVTNIQLPPMFQYQRIPAQPNLMPSAMMPQPLSMAEIKNAAGHFTTFVTADPAIFPSDWASATTSKVGFTVKNAANEVQPVVVSPILGLADSRLLAGQSLQRSFRVGVMASNWNDALEYISDSIYKVRDYRTQNNTSLTEAAFNMMELIRHDTASGWDAALKGFYDIEANPQKAPTVVQASPLAIVSAAVISKDEDFYIKRALPTIEYTLSRSGFRWARAVAGTIFNNDPKSLLLSPYNSQFTTAYYAGLHQLLGEANPWLVDIALPQGAIRPAKGYSVQLPAWTQELAAYRLTGEEQWIEAAKAGVARFVANDVYGIKTKPLGTQPFYNTSFYSYWWDLLDMYEVTKDATLLKAAAVTAFQTLAGVRVYPLVKDTWQTIHPGNVFEGNTTLWWKGDTKYRLGFPRRAGDAPEKHVPQSLVSPVGLGFEQPFTFFEGSSKAVRHVYMSSWAPHLLRLYQADKRAIFETYARNAVIGRFTNYPGYYVPGFTDITMQPQFPYKGPDVSSIYYHHIPPHLAFTLDYVVTEAIQRSNGHVHFPYGKQDGFVWFNNRLFGGGKGRIYDDNRVSLWMKKGLVQVDKPEINYVTAVSDDRFWLLLMNEAPTAVQANVQVGSEVPVASQSTASLYTAAGSKKGTAVMSHRKLTVSLAAKGFTALSIPLSAKQVPPAVQPVNGGMKVVDLGEPWGKCYVFRIRSPFGWDSIYGYLETAPLQGATATITVNGKTDSKNAYPYEWSFHSIDTNAKVTCTLQLTLPGGKAQQATVVFE
jgi:hypothetical protein